MSAFKKRVIVLAAAAVVLLVGARIWAVQAEAAWPPITTERYGQGDVVALEGSFLSNKDEENTDDYSVKLVDAHVMSYNEFVAAYAKHKEDAPFVDGLDSPSVVDLELQVSNDGDSSDKGGIFLLGLKLFPERRNTYFLWNTALLQVEYDNFEDKGVGFAVDPHSTQTVHIPFTINGIYEDKTEYKQSITDTNFELVVTNSPIRNVIDFSV